MSTACVTALPPGDVARRQRLCRLAQALGGDDAPVSVLFYGDGVFNLVQGSEAAADLLSAPLRIYAIKNDVADRGLTARLIPQAEAIDYARAAELVMEAESIITGV